MKVLRLANSNDRALDLPDPQRAWRIAEAALSEAIGEPVETVVREIWPSDELPRLIEGWIERYQPDIIFFKPNMYCTSYESVPLRLERRLGRLGTRVGKAGKDAADRPVGNTRAFKLGRLLLLRTIGGDTYFELDYVMALVEQCLRRIVAHEEIVVLVEGSSGRRSSATGWGGERCRDARQSRMHRALHEMCGRMRIAYCGTGEAMASADRARFPAEDGLHRGVEGQRDAGLIQGARMAEAWRAAHGSVTREPAGRSNR